MEQNLRLGVEVDINRLRAALDDLAIQSFNFEKQFETLQDELQSLKKNHEEEMSGSTGQNNGDVSMNLTQSLNDIRDEYEQINPRKGKDIEDKFENQMTQISQEVTTSSQAIETLNKKLTEIRRNFQNLEIELQSQLSMKNLEDVKEQYHSQLVRIQAQISEMEAQLSDIREEIECQNQEYSRLLDAKVRLEKEIATYCDLLEEGQQDVSWASGYGGKKSGGRVGGESGSGERGGGGSGGVKFSSQSGSSTF